MQSSIRTTFSLLASVMLTASFLLITSSCLWAKDPAQPINPGSGDAIQDSPQAHVVTAIPMPRPDNFAEPKVDTRKIPELAAALEIYFKAESRLHACAAGSVTHDDAVIEYNQAETALRSFFAFATGLRVAEIDSMREENLGWLDIAQLLNVSPQALGLESYYAQGSPALQINTADSTPFTMSFETAGLHTSRSLTGGLPQGHGINLYGESHQQHGLGAEMFRAGTGGPDINFVETRRPRGLAGFTEIERRSGNGGPASAGAHSGPGQGNPDGGGMGGVGGAGGRSGGKSACLDPTIPDSLRRFCAVSE